jgi:hypothetical protein
MAFRRRFPEREDDAEIHLFTHIDYLTGLLGFILWYTWNSQDEESIKHVSRTIHPDTEIEWILQ